ncbi:MAG: hypothetical protein JWL90_4062 [Chthoniobacteraceae bacterium]|nr:hypothetical protein [Chthoniobacteraceae bacterium]
MSKILESHLSKERENYHAAVLAGRFGGSTPRCPREAAANAVLDIGFTDPIQENRRLLVEGVPVEYQVAGETIHDLVHWNDQQNE